MSYAWEHPLYRENIRFAAGIALPWEKLAGKNVLLTGASGMIGSFLADVLMERNAACGADVTVVAVCRDRERARMRFAAYENDAHFCLISHDVTAPFDNDELPRADFVLHLASNTHPVSYATDPIGTVCTNIIGTRCLLDYAVACQAKRFLFCSSVEIYGENRGDTELFNESYCGYIDCNTLRAGYPESKRCGETLCRAYERQYGLDTVIPRLARIYGPTLLKSDTKALSQFLTKGLAGEDIVLKSAGTQYFSYLHVADAVTGTLTVLLKGGKGEAYNVADEASDIRLKDLAALIAEHAGTKVIFDLPDATEAAGFSKATLARMDASKLKELGWSAIYGIDRGIGDTMEILRQTERV